MVYKEDGIFKDLIEINRLIDDFANINYIDYNSFNGYYKNKNKIIKQTLRLVLTYILDLKNNNDFVISKENVAQFEMMIFHITNSLDAEIQELFSAIEYFSEFQDNCLYDKQYEHLVNNITFIKTSMECLVNNVINQPN